MSICVNLLLNIMMGLVLNWWRIDMHLSIGDLGRRLTRREVQDLLGISEDILLSDPLRFGGVWFGPRKLVFFEKLISEAIREMYASQKEQKE